MTPFEREHPRLLHARVGAALARRDLPGIGEGVLSAIAVHTVGAVPMTPLDQVVYLADMIEPARTYAGVDERARRVRGRLARRVLPRRLRALGTPRHGAGAAGASDHAGGHGMDRARDRPCALRPAGGARVSAGRRRKPMARRMTDTERQRLNAQAGPEEQPVAFYDPEEAFDIFDHPPRDGGPAMAESLAPVRGPSSDR